MSMTMTVSCNNEPCCTRDERPLHLVLVLCPSSEETAVHLRTIKIFKNEVFTEC